MANRLRVLIVDDNEASAQTMGWMMEALGHDYKLARSSAEALEIAPPYAPHLALLDIGMPGMDGLELCRRLRVMPELSATIFAAQTGWGQEQHRRQSQEAGFHHHFVKPVELKALQDLLASVSAT